MHRRSSALAAAIAATTWLFGYQALAQDAAEALPPSSQDTGEPADSTMDPSSDPSMSQQSTQDEDASTAQQSNSMDSMDPSTAGPTAPLDDKKIEQFANAYMEVQSIQQKAESELQTTTDPAAQDKVRTTAETDMISAVQRSGLQVQEFNQIVQSMASDVEVRNRVAAKLQERNGG